METEATEAAAAVGGGGGPGQELLVAWNTVSTGLVPPAALGLVRPGKGAAGPREVPGTLRALGRPSQGPLGFAPCALWRRLFPPLSRFVSLPW